MRSLTSTLLQAQRSGSAVPHVRVAVSDSAAGVARPVFRQVYRGDEANFHHAAVCAGDSSLVRVRVDPSDSRLYVQRVSSPGTASDFTSWTRLNSVSSTANVAMTARGATLNIFYVESRGTAVYRLESTNYGASWSSPIIVRNPNLGRISWLAAGVNDSGTLGLFYAPTSNVVYFIKQFGQYWTNSLAWGERVESITGMACAYRGGWNLAIAGTEQSSGDAKVWTCVHGDGGALADGAWSPLREMNTARSSSGVSFHHPFLACADVMRLTFVERYTGASNYQRSAHTHGLAGLSYADNLWREPVPLNIASTYGVAIASSASHLWLCTPGGVWRGDRRGSMLDLTEDVVALTVREEPLRGGAVIRLRNDHGRYGSIGEGALEPLRLGSTVSVSPGYETAAGREVSNGPSFSIQGFEHSSLGGRAELAIHAGSAWQALESWRARRQYTWEAGDETLPAIVRFMLARGGLQASIAGAGTEASSLSPSFTIHPGETAAGAVRRLLEKAPVVLQFSGHAGRLRALGEADAADYVYGADHPILRGRYRSGAKEYNRVQVFGKAHLGEAFDWEEVGEVFERLLQVHDLNMDTTQKALDRARSEMRRQAHDALGGEIVVPVNCGQELYDVIEVNDASSGLSTARRRVMGLELRYSRLDRPEYVHVLTLGGV